MFKKFLRYTSVPVVAHRLKIAALNQIDSWGPLDGERWEASQLWDQLGEMLCTVTAPPSRLAAKTAGQQGHEPSR